MAVHFSTRNYILHSARKRDLSLGFGIHFPFFTVDTVGGKEKTFRLELIARGGWSWDLEKLKFFVLITSISIGEGRSLRIRGDSCIRNGSGKMNK